MAEAARFRATESGGNQPRLILVRHGQASLGSGDYDRLSEQGHRQAERVAERLSAAMTEGPSLWSGTLLRHRQTLAPLAGDDNENALLTEDLNEFSTYGLVRAAVRQADRLGLALPPRHQLADPLGTSEQLCTERVFPEKPQIAWCDASDSSRSYGRAAQRARCGFSGKTLRDGPLRGLRSVSAHSFGTTKPRSPNPERSLPQRPVAPAQSCSEVP